MRVTKLYSKDFLLNHLYKAAIYQNAKDFVVFQVDQINQNIAKFQSDFLTVNIIHLNDKFLLDGDITSAVAHNSQDTIQNYQRHLVHDKFTPISFLNTGTALFNTAFCSMEEWVDQPIYKLHCTPYDHHWVLGISYRFPHHKTTFIAFHYMRAKGTGFSPTLTEEFVEYISYPFYLGWLHIYGVICKGTLHDYLSLCVGMSESRFRVVRAIAGQGVANPKLLGSGFGVSDRAIEEQVYRTNEFLLTQKEGLEDLAGIGKANRILNISKNYHFFEFGSGNFERKLERRKFDW